MNRLYILYHKSILNVNKLIMNLCLICYVSQSMEITKCNKMWGVTQDANGEMLYKVSMYMCIEDPYNIYKSTYLRSSKSSDTTLSNYSTTIEPTTTTTIVPTTTTTIVPTDVITSAGIPNINTTNITFLFENKSQPTNESANRTNPTSLRTQRTNKEITQVNQQKNILHIILIISGIVLIHIIVIGTIYYKKRHRKIQQDKSGSHLNTPIRKHQLKPFANEVPSNFKPDENITMHKKKHPIPRVLNKPSYTTRKKPLAVNTLSKQSRTLNIKHDALTPNTKKILDESKRSVKTWYKKTFPSELRQSSNDIPLPPSYAITPSLPDRNGNVKLMVNQKEEDIRRIDEHQPSFFAR